MKVFEKDPDDTLRQPEKAESFFYVGERYFVLLEGDLDEVNRDLVKELDFKNSWEVRESVMGYFWEVYRSEEEGGLIPPEMKLFCRACAIGSREEVVKKALEQLKEEVQKARVQLFGGSLANGLDKVFNFIGSWGKGGVPSEGIADEFAGIGKKLNEITKLTKDGKKELEDKKHFKGDDIEHKEMIDDFVKKKLDILKGIMG